MLGASCGFGLRPNERTPSLGVFAARFAAERRETVGHPGTTQRWRLSHLISSVALWGTMEQAATSSIPSSKRLLEQCSNPCQAHAFVRDRSAWRICHRSDMAPRGTFL